jgi:apolipoprotein D and lipocalin family protein
VGTPSRKYLWILSRSPQVEPSRYEALLARVSAQGYDLSQLQKTPQGPR